MSTPDRFASPAMLRELAIVAHQWQIKPLLGTVDSVLASQMRADREKFQSSDAKTWQYSGTHIRERSVQLLKLAFKVRFQQELDLCFSCNLQIVHNNL